MVFEGGSWELPRHRIGPAHGISCGQSQTPTSPSLPSTSNTTLVASNFVSELHVDKWVLDLKISLKSELTTRLS